MSQVATQDAEWRLPSPRKVAVISLLFAESALFTIFVVAYLFYIGKSLNPPYPHDVLEMPIISSICLLSSSIFIVLAERAMRAGKRAAFLLWWGVTIVLALVFLLFTALEWKTLIVDDGLTVSINVFGSTFFALVGLHATHVILGSILLATVWIFGATGKLKENHHEQVEMVSWYWHFVDVVWIVVLIVVYMIGR